MSKNVLDFKLAILTVVTLGLLIPVFSIFHEMGHGIICNIDGRDFIWGLDPLGGAWLSCEGTFNDPTLFRLAGGLFSAFTASTIFILINLFSKNNLKLITIPLATIAVAEYVVAMLEGFANDFYMNSEFSRIIAGLIILIMGISLILKHCKKPHLRNNSIPYRR